MKIRFIAIFLSAVCCTLSAVQAQSPEPFRPKVGAWYFGGWSVTPDQTGHTFHISPTLTSEYADRMPEWGWREDVPGVMERQIDYAADAGLDFWGICWYETGVRKEKVFEELNTVFDLFLAAPNNRRLDFFLLSCQPVSPESWDAFCDKSIALFKKSNYLRVDGKPVMTFFNVQDVIRDLGGEENARKALESYRRKARAAGVGEILLGAVTECQGDIAFQSRFKRCGFDFLTTYNNSNTGRKHIGENDYANLTEGDRKSWDVISACTKQLGMNFLPSMTAGYDMRPWGVDHPTLPQSDYWYTGVTPQRIAGQLETMIEWVQTHSDRILGGNLSIIYAWNENGEGGWLTPTASEGNARLTAIGKILNDKKKK